MKEFLKDYSVNDLFCGMGGFSLGFQQAGLRIDTGYDSWELATKTYETYLHADTETVRLDEYFPLQKDYEIIIVGGSPCDDFSRQNRHRDVYSKRSQLALDFCRIVNTMKPEVFVYENVLNIPEWVESALKGIKDYNVTKNIIDSKFYGCPSSRKRKIFIGSKTHTIKLIHPIRANFVTVRDAFSRITSNWGYMNHKEATIEKFSKITSHSWHSANDSSEYEGIIRLNWNLPAPTITDVKKAQMLHPDEDRTITVAEASALQGFPEYYVPFGSNTKKSKMIANAVPPDLSKGIANGIIQRYCY